MREAMRKVYYCDHCQGRRMRRDAMERHEKHCTANPTRVCRVCDTLGFDAAPLEELRALMPVVPEDPAPESYGVLTSNAQSAFPALVAAADGCPACILAALRQTRTAGFIAGDTWSYKDAMAEAWKDHDQDDGTYY